MDRQILIYYIHKCMFNYPSPIHDGILPVGMGIFVTLTRNENSTTPLNIE